VYEGGVVMMRVRQRERVNVSRRQTRAVSAARVGAAVAVAIGVVLWLAAAWTPQAAAPCEFEGVERIVAVGDVHGAYDRYVEILRATQIIDDRQRWSGSRAHLVQLGDVLDRGPDSRKVVDLLRRLDREAPSKGGRVHFLLGNHEVMRLLGDMRYVHPGEYTAFQTPRSEEMRERLVQGLAPNVQDKVLKETPLGQVEMRLAFGRQGDYGDQLRRLNAVVRINGVVFLHGGISPSVAGLRCDVINDTVRKDLTAALDRTRASPASALTTREDGPLWYRGLALEPETFAPEVDEILSKQQAQAIAVAHTVSPTRRITSRFDGKVLLLDTGMQPAYVPDGRASALEIQGGVFTAIYLDGREVVNGRRP